MPRTIHLKVILLAPQPLSPGTHLELVTDRQSVPLLFRDFSPKGAATFLGEQVLKRKKQNRRGRQGGSNRLQVA